MVEEEVGCLDLWSTHAPLPLALDQITNQGFHRLPVQSTSWFRTSFRLGSFSRDNPLETVSPSRSAQDSKTGSLHVDCSLSLSLYLPIPITCPTVSLSELCNHSLAASPSVALPPNSEIEPTRSPALRVMLQALLRKSMDAGDESEQARLVGLDDRVRRRRELVGTLEELDLFSEHHRGRVSKVSRLIVASPRESERARWAKVPAIERRKGRETHVDDKEVLDDLGFGLVYELVSSESRTAGGDQVVDDDDVGAGGEGVLLHLKDVRAVCGHTEGNQRLPASKKREPTRKKGGG